MPQKRDSNVSPVAALHIFQLCKQLLLTKSNSATFKKLDWGVSDHHKASPNPIIFWKLQCALMDHNIFMKRIGSIIFILNHSGNFFWRTFFYCCCFLEFFHVWKPCFWIFNKKNFLVTQIFKCLTLQKNLYC